MASLMEELITTLEGENTEYIKLLELSKRKASVIVERNIPQLEKITDEEQTVVTRISRLDAKREEVTRDIANVINKDVETLKLNVLIDLMAKQPVEQRKLADVHDKLKKTLDQLRMINESNAELIKSALDMVEFDLNLVRSMRQAPETNNYGRSAVSVGDTLGAVKGFDAKQ